jgi:hypothetical protein
MWYNNADHPLRHYFNGLTEQTFMADLGVADPPLIDYLSMLLSRFVHTDAIFKLRSGAGKRLEEVAEMLMEVEEMPPEGRTSREVHRHIGDFTLFWTGVYPEVLKSLRSPMRKDQFINYCEQGKRSYLIASTFEDEPFKQEATVLRRISEHFELCAFGLTKVREEWERKPASRTGRA